MKRRIAKLAVSGALLFGGIAMPLALAAQPAHAAAPGGPWVQVKSGDLIEFCFFARSPIGTVYVNTQNDQTLCFLG